jgi:hypothetical protein
MKDVSEVTACVVDQGTFLPVARALARGCERVLYWSPECRANKSVQQACIGEGIAGLERVAEFWPMLDEIDLFVFPDSDLAGLQLHLEQLGKAVWGSRLGQQYEQDRQLFLGTLEAIGLDVPGYEVAVGLEALREKLRRAEDKYVKISHYRADMETRHWRSWDLDEGWLDRLAVRLLPRVKDQTPFLIVDPVETELELGVDTYVVDRRLPGVLLQGYERERSAYFAAVTKRENLPEPSRRVLEAFAPLLAPLRYRNALSLELRVKGEQAHFIDATQRFGLPSSASQMALWKNFPEIVWAGANGQLLEPEYEEAYSIEVLLSSGPADEAVAVEVSGELEEWCHFAECCFIDGVYVFPPVEGGPSHDLGWLLAVGDTPAETLDRAKELVEQLPPGVKAELDSIAGVIAEIEQAQDEGHEFAREEMPEPSEVIP